MFFTKDSDIFFNFSEKISLYHEIKCSSLLSLQIDGVYIRYFKLRFFGPTEFTDGNISSPRHWIAKKDTRIRKSELAANFMHLLNCLNNLFTK